MAGLLWSTMAALAAGAGSVPAGTVVQVRTTTLLSSRLHPTGSQFTATLDAPLVVDGQEVAPQGATVVGRVAESNPGGRIRGKAFIELELTSLTLPDGRSMPLATELSGREANGTKKKDAVRIGGATGAGTAIGAMAGGAVGAGVGALVGGAAGTGYVLATHGEAASIPAESVLTFRLKDGGADGPAPVLPPPPPAAYEGSGTLQRR